MCICNNVFDSHELYVILKTFESAIFGFVLLCFMWTSMAQSHGKVVNCIETVSCFPFLVGSFVLSGEGLCFPSASRTRLRGAHWMDDCLPNERLAYMSAYLLFQTLACQSDKPSRDITGCISACLTKSQHKIGQITEFCKNVCKHYHSKVYAPLPVSVSKSM